MVGSTRDINSAGNPGKDLAGSTRIIIKTGEHRGGQVDSRFRTTFAA